MGELRGVAAAVLSSVLGGTAVAVTRLKTVALDPLAIGALRFGIGTAVLLPLALARRAAGPQRQDWATVAGLGLLFFAVFPLLFNAALVFTTASRASLSLSILPLLTLALGAVLGVEALTIRKITGVLVAVAGIVMSLLAGLADAPPGASRGDLLMVGAALCMAFYSVLSRPVIRRCDTLAFTAAAMCVGAPCLLAAASSAGPWSRSGHSARASGRRCCSLALQEPPWPSPYGPSHYGTPRRRELPYPLRLTLSALPWPRPSCCGSRCRGRQWRD